MECKHCGHDGYRIMPIAPLTDDPDSHFVWFICLACNRVQTEVISTEQLITEHGLDNVLTGDLPKWQYQPFKQEE
jgi:hypothetical protein